MNGTIVISVVENGYSDEVVFFDEFGPISTNLDASVTKPIRGDTRELRARARRICHAGLHVEKEAK